MFGSGAQHSLGTLEFRIPLPNGTYLSLRVDVVDADIPLLGELDVMDRDEIVLDNVKMPSLDVATSGSYQSAASTGTCS